MTTITRRVLGFIVLCLVTAILYALSAPFASQEAMSRDMGNGIKSTCAFERFTQLPNGDAVGHLRGLQFLITPDGRLQHDIAFHIIYGSTEGIVAEFGALKFKLTEEVIPFFTPHHDYAENFFSYQEVLSW